MRVHPNLVICINVYVFGAEKNALACCQLEFWNSNGIVSTVPNLLCRGTDERSPKHFYFDYT